MTTASTAKQPLISNWIILFLIAMILANIGGNMYGPIMPLYVQNLGATVAQVGLFFTLSRVLPLIIQILAGYVSDSLGRLRAIAFGSIAGMFDYAALLLAPTWEWLFVSAAMSAIGGSLVRSSFDAFIAENSAEENRARVYGITQTIFGIVGVIGPVLGGWLADLRGFKFMIFIGAVFYFVATIMRIIMARHAAQKQNTPSEKLTFAGLKANLGSMAALMTAGGIVTWILITDGVRDVSFSLSFDFMPIFMQEIVGLTKTQIGILSSLFGVMMMVSMYPGGIIADKKGERFGITIAFFMQFIAIGLIAALPKQNIWTSVLGWSIAGLSVGLMAPAYQSLISKVVPANLRGTAFGLFNTSLGIISLPAPWLGAQLWENISPRFPFGITALALLFAGLIALWKFKLDRPGDQEKVSIPGQ